MEYVKDLGAWVCATCHDEEESTLYFRSRGDRASRDVAIREANRVYATEMRRLRRDATRAAVSRDPKLLAAVVASGPCVYCGAPAQVADHVRPLSQGGADDFGNLVPACQPCNNSKWELTLDQWIAARVEHAVRSSAVVAVEYARLTRQPCRAVGSTVRPTSTG